MHKSATKCNKTIGKWCKNKHGASKIIDTFETYQRAAWEVEGAGAARRGRASAASSAASGRGVVGDRKIGQPASVRELLAWGLSSLGDVGGRKETMHYKGGTFSTDW
jgi:hypothetical protein